MRQVLAKIKHLRRITQLTANYLNGELHNEGIYKIAT